MQKSVLGKGLASLLPGAGFMSASTPPPAPPRVTVETAEAERSSDRVQAVSQVDLDKIKLNPFQPRREFRDESIRELSISIQENGIIQPLVVRKKDDGFELIAGERRLRAARMAGLKQVPIIIRRTTDRESLELAIIENVQREDLNCIDEAMGYFQLLNEFSLTQEQVAKQVGKERATIANTLRLLKLPEVIISDLKSGRLSFGHGKALLGLDDIESRTQLRNEIIEKGLSVRGAEDWVSARRLLREAQPSEQTKAASIKSSVAQRLFALAQELTRKWSTRVEVRGSGRSGKVIVHYGSREDLERIVSAMHNTSVWDKHPTSVSPSPT